MARGFLGFTRDDVPPSRWQYLWLCVLKQAITDAFCPPARAQSGKLTDPVVQEQSIAYLSTEDCRIAVTFAGFDPEVVMPRLADMVRRHRAGEAVIEQYGPGYRVGDVIIGMVRSGGEKRMATRKANLEAKRQARAA